MARAPRPFEPEARRLPSSELELTDDLARPRLGRPATGRAARTAVQPGARPPPGQRAPRPSAGRRPEHQAITANENPSSVFLNIADIMTLETERQRVEAEKQARVAREAEERAQAEAERLAADDAARANAEIEARRADARRAHDEKQRRRREREENALRIRYETELAARSHAKEMELAHQRELAAISASQRGVSPGWVIVTAGVLIGLAAGGYFGFIRPQMQALEATRYAAATMETTPEASQVTAPPVTTTALPIVANTIPVARATADQTASTTQQPLRRIAPRHVARVRGGGRRASAPARAIGSAATPTENRPPANTRGLHVSNYDDPLAGL